MALRKVTFRERDEESGINDCVKNVYAEVGFGNDTFFSTEFEEGQSEYRIPKFILPKKVRGLYMRLWLFKHVFILSTNHGFEIKRKDRNKLKVILGISGEQA